MGLLILATTTSCQSVTSLNLINFLCIFGIQQAKEMPEDADRPPLQPMWCWCYRHNCQLHFCRLLLNVSTFFNPFLLQQAKEMPVEGDRPLLQPVGSSSSGLNGGGGGTGTAATPATGCHSVTLLPREADQLIAAMPRKRKHSQHEAGEQEEEEERESQVKIGFFLSSAQVEEYFCFN
jgi:hypothetical protein